MISAATAMPMPGAGPSTSRNWMKASIIAAAIYVAIGTATFAINKLFGLDAPTTGMLSKAIAAVLAFVAAVVPLVTYAMLTGPVLSEKLPAFSTRGWIVLHVVIGAVLGALVAGTTLFGPTPSGAPAAMPSARDMVVGGLIASSIFGPMVGALMGGLQALVLRRAATGLLAWILWSAAASTVTIAVLLAAAFGLAQNDLGVVSFLTMEVAIFAGMIIAAVIMLPAVHRLAPRGR